MGSASLAAAPPGRPNRDDNTPPARRAEGLKFVTDWEMFDTKSSTEHTWITTDVVNFLRMLPQLRPLHMHIAPLPLQTNAYIHICTHCREKWIFCNSQNQV